MLPKGLVRSSEEFSEVDIDFKIMSPFLTQSRIAKCLRSTCLKLLVALSLLETTILAALYSYILVDVVLKPRCNNSDLTYLTFVAAPQAA